MIAVSSTRRSSGAKTIGVTARCWHRSISDGLRRPGWFAAPGFEVRSGEPLRLASSSPSCGIRNLAVQALDAAGITWAETFLGCGSFGVADAVSAGLAVAVFPLTLVPRGTIEVGRRFALPALPSSEIILLSSLSDRNSRAILKTLASAFREHRDAAPMGTAA
jgi:DNA-binding transcriptional LysR family regulator